VISFTPQPLYPERKSPCYPLDRRLSGLQSRSGRGGEEKNSQPLPGLEPDCNVHVDRKDDDKWQDEIIKLTARGKVRETSRGFWERRSIRLPAR